MIWTKQRILEALKRLHKRGADLSYNALARTQQSLVSASAYHFGSYRKAVERAGIEYGEVIRRPRWSKATIVMQIKQAHRRGEDLHWSAVTKRGDELARAAFASLQPRLFGRWDRALVAAGLDVGEVSRYRNWSKATVVSALRSRSRSRKAMNSGALQRQDTGLHAAAVRYFGSYDLALSAAKIRPESIRQRRKWNKPIVMNELKKICRGKATPDAEIRKKHLSLYGAALRLYGSLAQARKAAGVKSPALSAQ